MPWDWTAILESLPAEKRDYFDSLHYQAEALPALPTTEKKAIMVHFMNVDSILFKAFEETFPSFDYSTFELRLKRLKRQLEIRQLNPPSKEYLAYFPGANLYFSDALTKQYLGRFRVPTRN